MADPNDDKTRGAPPRSVHVEGEEHKKTNWLPWLLLGLGLLALLLALSRCNRDEAPVTNETATETTVNETTTVENTAATGAVVGSTDTVSPATAAGLSTMGSYFQGTEAAPRTFNFEKLNFDSGKSEVRAADRTEISQVAAMLKQYPNARVRVVGYADASGAAGANQQLGQARAEAIKAALVSEGVTGDRVEAASGGESQAVDSNASAGGRAENRRTELVVTQR